MGINITEIGQKVLDNNKNAANVFRKMYDLYYNPNPLDVELPYIDENGNLLIAKQMNNAKFRKRVWDDVGGALGQFNRAFYVDSQNGDDNNTGTSDSPFKTLSKAIKSIPIGGIGTINLKTDYTVGDGENHISEDLLMFNKNIKIYTKNLFEIKDKARVNLQGNGQLSFVFNGSNAKLKVGAEDGWDYGGFYVFTHESTTKHWNKVSLYLSFIDVDNTNLIEIADGGVLIKSRPDGRGNIIDLLISDIYCDSSQYLMNGSSYLAKNLNGVYIYREYRHSDFVNENGDTLNVQDLFANIIKDSNGIPRNIISPVVF